MSKKVLFIVSNTDIIGPNKRRTGSFLSEVAHPYAIFAQKGHQVDFASLTGETPRLDALNLADDPDNLSFLVGKGWADMQKARKLKEVDVNGYDAIFIPGGLAPLADFAYAPYLKEIIGRAFERGTVIGAVCHGTVALLDVRLSDGSFMLQGKHITTFSNEEERGYAINDVPFLLESALTDQGALFSANKAWEAHSVVDGNLVTGQNPASAKGVGEKMIMLMENKIINQEPSR